MNICPFSKTYEGRTVLSFPGMELEPGRIYAVIGANGSGKSTFAKVLAGIIPADNRGKAWEGVSVGYMPQKNFAFRMTTRVNLLLNKNDARRAEVLLSAFGLTELAGKRADRLSGGETARMALARLMMRSYDAVILDEPTAAMDMETTLLAERLLADYVRETGCALILVTHSLQQARRLAHEVLFFRKGVLVERGGKERVLHAPKEQATKEFLEFYGV